VTRPDPANAAPAAHVTELLNSLVKALRAYHMYLPNNPIHQRATEALRAAFKPVWEITDELLLTVAETDFVWENQVVYHQPNKSESVAWGVFKDGMRSLTIRRGAEDEELPRFLVLMNRARFLTTDAGDDLLTLLWEQEYQFIGYKFIEFFGEGGGPVPETTGSCTMGGPEEGVASDRRRAQAVEEAPPRPKGVVDVEDFDSTLYFLDEREIQTIAVELEEEYRRDVRGSTLSLLFDLFELRQSDEAREEILGILDQLFPSLLTARDFRAAATILRECRVLAKRGADILPAHVERLEGFVNRLSEPAIVSQLIQSLDESAGVVADAEVAELLNELRASALEPVLAWLPNLSSAPLRGLLEGVADRLAEAHSAEVVRILRDPGSSALVAAIGVCGRLNLLQAVPGLGEAVNHADPSVRLASVQALSQLGTPAALALVDKALEDDDRGVRLAAVRVVSARGYKGAQRRVEAVVLGKAVKEMDLTEKMAFFEAYGAIAGASGLKAMSGILLPRGLLRMKESSETRACAAIAIGKIRTAEARSVLQQAADDKDLVVRNAVSRALRESAP
jgi:hypothetical protein